MPQRILATALLFALLPFVPAAAVAATIKVEVRGLEPALRDNVVAFLGLSRFSGFEQLDQDMESTGWRSGPKARRGTRCAPSVTTSRRSP